MGIKEQIYLLEIQVHDVHLESVKELECFDEPEIKMYGHFLSFEPAFVYDHLNPDFKALPVLFKMNPDELIKAIDRSPLTISVAGMLDETREYTVGTVKILFTEAFAEAITLATSSVMYPVIAQLDEVFPFRNLYHEESGTINVNLKLSCFGYIDMKKLGPCELQDQTKEIEGMDQIVCDDIEGNGGLKPTMIDLDQVQPASTLTGKFEGIREGMPWKMASDQQNDKGQFGSTQNRSLEKASITAEITDKSNEITLQCTCEAMPDFLSQKPPPKITLKCQCADILAAMKNVFPSIPQDKGPPAQAQEVQPVTSPVPFQSPDYQPQMSSIEPKLAPPPYKPVQSTPPGAPSSILGMVGDIVPTSAVCGLELKGNSPTKNVPSEEKVHSQPTGKQDNLRTGVSTVEVGEVKTDDSSKKIKEDIDGWDERKQVIKKEYKKKHKKVKDIYEYTAGMYPGMVVGHKYCIPTVRLVPRNMGWMWNLLDIFGTGKRNKGWRPGAIIKAVANNFGSWNKAAGFKDGDDAETYFNFKKKKLGKETEQTKEAHLLKPTLHVHKKDKFYHITVNPPGQSNVKPLTFKVDPRKGSSDEETSSESTSDDSFEFEYTVPAGLVPPPRKIEWSNETTQYNVQDFSPKKKVEAQAPPEELPKERKDSKGKGGSKGGKGGSKGGKGGSKGGKGGSKGGKKGKKK